MADGSVPVVLSPVPFSRAVQHVEAPAGSTVRANLTAAVKAGLIPLSDLPRTNVYIDGVRLERADALDHVLTEGQIVNIVVEPLGGGGGGRKDVGQILLTLAVIAVSVWVGGGSFLPNILTSAFRQQLAAAIVLTLGQAAVAAIFAPDSAEQAKVNERYALQSASNQYRPWQAFPLALGEVVVAPDMAVKTFTQAIGDDVWIYGILALHYGPCEVSELKIGDTLVSSMGAGDFRMAQHLTPGPRNFQIYPNDVDQLDLQEELAATSSSTTPVVRAGSNEGELFEFDFFMPQGLNYTKDDGRLVAAALTVTIQYRPIDNAGTPTGAGTWLPGTTQPLNAATNEPWRLTSRLSLPLGRYQFRIERTRRADDLAKRHDQIAITAIRAIAFRKPLADETVSVIEFAARATALNQGSLAPITCRLKPICETWTGSAWGPPVATSNPAALTRWLLTGPAPAKPLLSVEADLHLRTWSALCDEYDWKASFYLIEDRKQDAVMGLLEQAGRASLFWDGSQIVASPWVEKPVPRQLFADENLKDHRWTIVYPEEVHALRVEFQNIDQGGDPDELYVYADGYAETAGPGVAAAVLVEALRVEGQKTAERAYRDGRWELGRRLHQRRIDTWTTDIEHVVCRYGDRVRLGWQRASEGTSARVRCRHWSGGLVAGLRLTQAVEMLPGEEYAVDMRLGDALYSGVPVVNQAIDGPFVTRSIVFKDPRSDHVSPKGDDLVAFGVVNRVSEDVEIIGIEPGAGLTAVLTGIRYVAPLLMAGETGPIPPLQSRLTRARSANPPQPTLLGMQVESSGVRVTFSMPPWSGSPISGYAVRWRSKPKAGANSGWASLPDLPANAMVLTTPPMREVPAEADDITAVEISVTASTVAGQSSDPLIVTAQLAVVDRPAADAWAVMARPADADGTQQPGLVVTGIVRDGRTAMVLIEYGASATGPWKPAYSGPPTLERYEINGLSPGAAYWVSITGFSDQGVPSVRRVFGPCTAPGLVSGDVLSSSPTINAINDAIAAVEAGSDAAVASLNAAIYAPGTGLLARSDAMFADINTATTGLKAQTTSLLASLNTPTTGVLARLTTVENSSSTGISAAASRITALEATVNTAGSGIVARLATAESAIATNNAAAVSRLSALETTINTAGTGLSARTSTLETANANLAANKADASRVATIEADLNTASTGLKARTTAIETATSNLATSKADATRVTALEATVNTAGTGLSARLGTAESAIATNNAAAVSRLGTLEATVNTAGTGLSARTSTLETATTNLTANKADATRVAALEATINTAGTGLSARLATVESAVTTNNTAAVTRLSLLEAAAGGDALNLNSTFANFPSPSGLAPNLTATDVPAASYSRTTGRVSAYAQRVETTANVNLQGFRWAWPTNNWRSFLPERGGGDYWVLEYKIEASSGGIDGVGFGFEIIKGDGSAGGGASYLIGLKSLVGGGVGDDVICEGSHFFRADRTQARTSANLWFYGANNGFPTYNGVAPGGISAAKRLYVHRLSVRAATEAEISAQVALPAVSARLTTAESAITTNNSAATSRLTSLEATVNTVGTGITARLTTVESVAASANGTAKAIKGVITDVNGRIGGYASSNDGTTTSFEILASVFGIRDTGSGLRTEYRSGIWYVYDPDAATRTMYGKAFGGANKLTWWTGPASVAEGSETKANAYVFISTVAPRFGGTDTPGGGVFTASAPGVRVKTQIGGTGAITTPSVPITVAGNTGTVTYSWSVVFGDIDGITISSATSANPTFSANPAGVARLQAIWAWTATDSGTGITRGGQTYVTIQRDA